MPETPFQRIVATAMLISAALLILLAVRETTRSDKPEVAATVARAPDTTLPATTQTTATQTTTAQTASEEPPATTQPAPAQPPTRLVLLASGGDSWLTVRADSAQGEVLYEGLLAQGTDIDVKAKQLWVRFGGASNITAQLNGKPLELRAGTYNALISPAGLQLVGG